MTITDKLWTSLCIFAVIFGNPLLFSLWKAALFRKVADFSESKKFYRDYLKAYPVVVVLVLVYFLFNLRLVFGVNGLTSLLNVAGIVGFFLFLWLYMTIPGQIFFHVQFVKAMREDSFGKLIFEDVRQVVSGFAALHRMLMRMRGVDFYRRWTEALDWASQD